MTLKSILIDSNKTKAMKINDDKVQVDIVAIPVDEENDVELSVKVGLYINGQLFDNLESDMDGYIKKTLVIPNGSDQYITLKLEDLTQGIQSKIKNVLILGSQEGQEEKEDMERLKDEIINLKKQIINLGDTKRKEIESESELEKNEVLQIVSRNGMKLGKDKCKKYNDDDEIVIAAVKQNGLALEFASENLKNDQNICLEAVKQNGLALKFVSENFKKNDLAICLAAVNQDIFAAKFIPQNIVNNEKILEVLFLYGLKDTYDFKNNLTCFGEVDFDLRYMVSQYDISEFIETKYKFVKENKDFVLSLMKKNKDKISDIFNSMGKTLRDDKDIMTFMINNNVSYFKKIGKELAKDEEFVLSIIGERGIDQVEKYLNEDTGKLPKIKKIVDEHKECTEKTLIEKKRNESLKKAKNNGILDEEFCNDKEIVIEAIKKNISTFQKIGQELVKDEELLLRIIEEVGIDKVEKYLTKEMGKLPGIKKIADEYKKDNEKRQLKEKKDRALEVARTKGTFEKEFNDDKEVVLEALRKNINSFRSIGEKLQKDAGFVCDCMKEFGYTKIYPLLSEESKSFPKIKKIIEEKDKLLKELGDLKESIKDSDSLNSQMMLLGKKIKRLSNSIDCCLITKNDAVGYLNVESEKNKMEKLCKKTRRPEERYEYNENLVKLQHEMLIMNSRRNNLEKLLKEINVDIIGKISPSFLLNLRFGGGAGSIIGVEIQSGFKCLSDYIIKIEKVLEILEKDYREKEVKLKEIERNKNRINEINQQIDKI